jgi:hypothetical protein
MTNRLRGKGKVGVPGLYSSNNTKLLKVSKPSGLQIPQINNNGQIKRKVTLLDTMEH